jgi:N-acetylneuraminate synthase
MKYLDSLVRGVFAKRDIPKGLVISHDNFDEFFYMAIPLLKGQLSCREIKNGEMILKDIKADDPLTIDDIDSPYSRIESLKKSIYDRGM